MIRVLHATMSFARGGRREAIRTLAAGQQSLGASSDLCCLEHLACHETELAGAFDRYLVLHRKKLFDRSALRRLVEFCDSRGIEIFHAHDAASQAVGAMLHLKRPRTRLLMTFHRTRGIDSATYCDRLRNALATLFCGAIVVASRERREHLLHENF